MGALVCVCGSVTVQLVDSTVLILISPPTLQLKLDEDHFDVQTVPTYAYTGAQLHVCAVMILVAVPTGLSLNA